MSVCCLLNVFAFGRKSKNCSIFCVVTEKARLQAEAKAAEDARRQAEAEAAAELKRKRELERAAARQALSKVSAA